MECRYFKRLDTPNAIEARPASWRLLAQLLAKLLAMRARSLHLFSSFSIKRKRPSPPSQSHETRIRMPYYRCRSPKARPSPTVTPSLSPSPEKPTRPSPPGTTPSPAWLRERPPIRRWNAAGTWRCGSKSRGVSTAALSPGSPALRRFGRAGPALGEPCWPGAASSFAARAPQRGCGRAASA